MANEIYAADKGNFIQAYWEGTIALEGASNKY